MAQEAILSYFQSQKKGYDFHCYKGRTSFVIYGRERGLPSAELDSFLKSFAESRKKTIDKYRIKTCQYDEKNRCLILTIEHAASTPRTRLRAFSECSAACPIPSASYESIFLQYVRQGKRDAALEIFDRAVASGVTPTEVMILEREDLVY
jgi:pentatricopeptide repeat protein